MPEINLPEVKLPEFKWPDGLRDMNREDIVNAARDVRMPKRSDLPDIDLSKIDLSKIDLSKIELPKQISDRLPNRKRSNPLLPIAGFVAIGAAIAAAWWLITSPVTGPRIRHAVNDLKARMNGESNDLVRYDDESDLGSLLAESPTVGSSPLASDPYTTSNGMTDLGDGVPVGPGEMSEGARSV
jgi:hypothetical protein